MLPLLTATAVLAAAVAPGVLAVRGFLVGDVGQAVTRSLRTNPADRAEATRTEFAAYLQLVPAVDSVLAATSAAAGRIWSDPTTDGSAKVTATRARVVVPLTTELARLRRFPTGAPQVRALHAELLEALELAVRSYDVLLRSGGSPTSGDLTEFRQLRAKEVQHLRAWRSMRAELARRLLASRTR
jgi:hypothetical protein